MILGKSRFLVKQRIGLMKLTNTYDILDPDTQEQIATAKEEIPAWAKLARLVVGKKMLPTTVNIYESPESSPAITVRRKVGLLRVPVVVTMGGREVVGHFKSKVLSLGGGFLVFNAKGQQVAEIKGDWKGWNFRMLSASGVELGTVTKKWAGVGKELFTQADTYLITLADEVVGSPAMAALMLAAGLAVDLVFKEES